MREIVKKGHEVHVLAPYTGGEQITHCRGCTWKDFTILFSKIEKLSGRSG
jgi:hypothetical protein